MGKLSYWSGALVLALALTCGAEDSRPADFAAYRAQIQKIPGLERYYTFDEGEWYEVKNWAPVFPGENAMSGGPLGSLSIKSTTPYGMDYNAYEPERLNPAGTIQPRWTQGRIPGKSALALGTRKDTTYRSGITGDEFQKAWTFAAWVKVNPLRPAEKLNGTGIIMQLGNAYSNGFRLECGQNSVALRMALPARDKQAQVQTVSVKGFTVGTWHFITARWDGENLELAIDGQQKNTQKLARSFVPIKPKTDWCGWFPFNEAKGFDWFRLGGGRTAMVTLDELALFSRAVSDAELAQFRKILPVAQEPEPDTRAIQLAIPHDTNGYFRINEPVPVTVRGAEKAAKLAVAIETLDGQKTARREIPLTNGNLDEKITFPQCGVYWVDLTLLDNADKVVKKLAEPYCVGIVPPAPATLDSPFALWATEDAFHYDMNMRRLFIWAPLKRGETLTPEKFRSGLKLYRHNMEIFRKKQRLADKNLKIFQCFTLLPTKNKTLTDAEIAMLQDSFAKQVEVVKQDGTKWFEVTSEINNHLSPEAYVEQMKILAPIIRQAIPDALIFPPGATPNAVPYINKLLALGIGKYVDGVSIHPYVGNPVHSYHWGSIGKNLQKVCEKYPVNGKVLPIYNTESGIMVLNRVGRRPMDRGTANKTRLNRTEGRGGFQGWVTSMLILPEAEAAAMQCQLAIMDLATGFKIYTKCQNGIRGAIPNLQGVAITALSGQILNHMQGTPRMLPLSTLKSAAVLIKRQDNSNALAVFGMADETLNFSVAPQAKFRTMDLYGNFGEISADSAGLLTLKAKMAPFYIFNVPENIEALSLMKIDFPAEIPDSGKATGKLTLNNPFAKPLTGKLRITPLRGADISLNAKEINLAPDGQREVTITFNGSALKRGEYSLKISLDETATAEKVFKSAGTMIMIPSAGREMPLDGDLQKWETIPAIIADSEVEVVKGKPNMAEPWVPQWKDPRDLSLKTRVTYVRGEAVHFMAEVTDDRLLTAPASEKGRSFMYDGLELFVDTRVGKALGAPKDLGADQIVIIPNITENPGPCAVWYPKSGNLVQVACVGQKTANGYLIEGKITPNADSQFRVLPGSQMLLDFVIDDTDQPDKLRKTVMALHGTLNNAFDVDKWGRYELAIDK